MAVVISPVNRKGGVGKSSSVYHLSGYFASQGLRVLCIDNEPQHSLTNGFLGRELSDSLERGAIAFFPQSPVALPADDDLDFFRQELPRRLKRKNISYHPESGSTRGLDSEDAEMVERVNRVLKNTSDDIADFLGKAAPRLTRNWTVGTCSFRPMQEQGRNLSAHASNELIHVDAGAYGATNGDRILRFFINVNPEEDRVWATKGSFPELFAEHGERAQLGHRNAGSGYLSKGPLDHLRSGMINLAALGVPVLKVLDSSPNSFCFKSFE